MPLNISWKTWAWIGVGLLFIIAVLIATGVIPGLTKRVQKTTLELWGYDSRDVWESVITAYRKDNPTVNINYTQLPANTYEEELVDRLASGRGPDIFMVQNTWLPKHGTKLAPLSPARMSAEAAEELFPAAVIHDFTLRNTVYALPVYLDTLALFYNKDIFDRAGIVAPPTNWIDFREMVRKLGKNSASMSTTDMISLFMLQSGVPMINDEGRADLRGAESPLSFYLQFPHTPDSFELFARGKLAMMFSYHSFARALRATNPALRFGVGDMPQSSRTIINYPSYAGLAVWNQSQHADDAWQFIIAITTKPALASLYLSAVDEPPALRTLISQFQANPSNAVFANQALTARSWPQPDSRAVDGIFEDMVDSIEKAGMPITTALRTAEAQINALINRSR